VYNVVDYSATSFPCGISVDKALDKYASDYKAQSGYCQGAYDSCKWHIFSQLIMTNECQITLNCLMACRSVCSKYYMKLLCGGNANLCRLVAQRLEEEKVLAMTGTVLEAIRS